MATDEDRLKWLLNNLECDGYGFWFPELCIKECTTQDGTPPTLDDLRRFIDERMKR